jgi:ribosome biogenesis GTPase A
MKVRYSFSSRRTRRMKNIRKQKQKYPDLVKKIVLESDIILEILDARFINETRNHELEKEIIEGKKKIIFVVNKSDLVNKFKKLKLYPYIFVSCSKRKGIKDLRNLIKRESNKIEKEGKVFVGVIGYPNTGKSSLINILIGKKSAGTGAEAGFTKGIQKLKLSSDIVLFDTPGVIPEKECFGEKAISKQTIVGGRSYSQVKNPEIVVLNIIKDFKGILEKFYNINAKGDTEILIEKLGERKGFFKRKGEIDEDKVARFILKDWQEGKIKV